MKRLLVDALSVNNLSGRHVLLGHLRELVSALSEEWQFTLLVHRDNATLVDALPEGVAHMVAQAGAGWWSRTAWGWRHFDRIARECGADLAFSPSGMLSPGCSLPQVVLAQNPWPLMQGAKGLRLWLQRRGFARAQQRAWRMVFNSAYMQHLYADAFGPPPRESLVAYQGINPICFEQDSAARGLQGRQPHVLTVSVMARHKAIETLIDAFSVVARACANARLVLVGSWPDVAYRREIEGQVTRAGLTSQVEFLGHTDAATLHAQLRSARVFCLLSRCESFGIPAVEAQAAGTPTVVAAGTAAPEITGLGGVVVPQDNPASASAALLKLLQDDRAWSLASAAARANADHFHWGPCSAPLVALLREFAQAAGAR
jgi:glycosyltransferase involved in cell wall biosynthesis